MFISELSDSLIPAPLRVSGGSRELTRPGRALCSGKSIWGPDRRGHGPGCSASGVDVAPSLPLRWGATHFGGPPGERPPFGVCLSGSSFARPLICTLRDMGTEEFPGGGVNVRSPRESWGRLAGARAAAAARAVFQIVQIHSVFTAKVTRVTLRCNAFLTFS